MMSKQGDVVTQPSPLVGSRFCFIARKAISPSESIWPRTDKKRVLCVWVRAADKRLFVLGADNDK